MAPPPARPPIPGPRLLLFLGIGALLRAALLLRAGLGPSSAWLLAWGALADLGPALIWDAIAPAGRRIALPIAAALWAVLLFGGAAQLTFFEEFRSRPDQLVIEYVLYLGEVTGNVWESYPVVRVVLACLVGGALLAIAEARLGSRPRSWAGRGTRLAAGAVLLAAASEVPPPSSSEVARQVGQNGAASLLAAARTGHLEYATHYATVAPGAVWPGVHELLAGDPTVRAGDPGPTHRVVPRPGGVTPRHVFLVMAESLGAEYVGELGAENDWTPRLDEWLRRGTVFTRVLATGTRTARGLESVLSSFPPLPGTALPHRELAAFPSLASVLRDRGWSTTFVYGGDLGFDGMSRFLPAIGFERQIGGADIEEEGAVRTSWGLDDRLVLRRGLAELEEARRSGRSSLVAVLTVSNHRPFIVPGPGGEPVQGREAAVRFADAALGELLDAAERGGALADTLFVLVADHGPRGYLRDRVPLDAHHVPFALWGAGVGADRIPTLGSSLDVTPTVLGVLGDPYDSPFFGRDLRAVEDGGWAVVQDKWDLALVRGGKLAVLALQQRTATASVSADDRVGPLEPAAPGDPDVAAAAALYRGAYDVLLASLRGQTGAGLANASLARGAPR